MSGGDASQGWQQLLTSPLALQGMPIQLHAPYSSEHAKVPVGSITMGLPLTMDPKKLGKGLGGEWFLGEAWEANLPAACRKEEHRTQQ